jgi:Zn-dependent metalloprotease
MKKIVVRGALFAALSAVGGCAISDETPGTENDGPSTETPSSDVAPVKMAAVSVKTEQALAANADLATSADAYLAANIAAVGAGDRFEVIAKDTALSGSPFVRVAQVHRGVPVFGAELVVHTSKGSFVSANGNVQPGLDTLNVVPTVGQAKAFEVAKLSYLGQVTERIAKLEFSRENTRLVILPMEGAAPRLVWQVTFFTELQGGVKPGLWNFFVDAKSGQLVKKFNAIHTLSQASGPGGNAKVARTWTNALDVEPSGAQFAMDTVRLQTTNMNNGTSGNGTIVVGPLSPIGDAPINDAHGFSEATLNMLLDWQGENSINGAGFKVRSRVHYSSSYENAFWDGTQMTYGDGATTFYPLSGSADVAGHEINHGYTTFHSNLTYSAQSGGMNESFSDIAGEMTEAYIKNGAPDMLVGADIFKSATGALRYMCNPRQDGRSLDNISQYTSGVDVHYSSGIMNKAFCLIANRLASGTTTGPVTLASIRRAGAPFYLANKQIWTAGSTFQQGCQGVWDAATLLGYTTAEKCFIRQSWIDVGLTCGDATLCGGTPPPTGNSYAYSATNTNSAQQNTVNKVVALSAGQQIVLGSCGVTGSAFTGDTYLRLFGPAAAQVAFNDDACGGLGSQITYTATAAGNYEIRGGCYTTGSCTATVAWTITGGTPPSNGTFNYTATNTASATANTTNQNITAAAGQVITVATCGAAGSAFTGDTYLRLNGPAATEVAANDDACSGLGSSLSYTATAAGTFQIRAGCYSTGSCTGTVVWSVQ